jgi:hypothetical protein
MLTALSARNQPDIACLPDALGGPPVGRSVRRPVCWPGLDRALLQAMHKAGEVLNIEVYRQSWQHDHNQSLQWNGQWL